VRLVVSRKIRLAIDERIWREYEVVISRPHLNISAVARRNVLAALS